MLRGSKLGEFDSVKKVSILVDFLRRQIRFERKGAKPRGRNQTAKERYRGTCGVLGKRRAGCLVHCEEASRWI